MKNYNKERYTIINIVYGEKMSIVFVGKTDCINIYCCVDIRCYRYFFG